MKFSSGIDGLTKENSFLRKLTLGLVALCGALLGTVCTLFDRPPVLILRSSHGLEIVSSTRLLRTEDEVRAAIRMMVQARFATDFAAPEVFLNAKQIALKDAEQKDMKSRNMSQAAVVRKIILSKDEAVVDFDRVISVGEIRSALKSRVKIAMEEVTPHESNPYGLVLSLADPVLEKKGE